MKIKSLLIALGVFVLFIVTDAGWTDELSKYLERRDEILSGLYTLSKAFTKGVVDSHIIILFMLYFFSFTTYKYLEFRSEKEPFDRSIESFSKGEYELLLNDPIYKVNQSFGKSENRAIVKSNISVLKKNLETKMAVFDHNQNIIALLGFIGTVLGLILAIGLTEGLFGDGQANDTNSVMSKVVKGLSIAFVTTAFSLLFTVIINFFKNNIEKTYTFFIEQYEKNAELKIQNDLKADDDIQQIYSTIISKLKVIGGNLGELSENFGSAFKDNLNSSITTLNKNIVEVEELLSTHRNMTEPTNSNG